MSIVKQPSNGKGSLKDIQLLINVKPSIINTEIKRHFKELKPIFERCGFVLKVLELEL
jgi:hypothetical protein